MTTPIYHSYFPQHCRTHPIDGMTLVFHRPSGTTHFLDSPVPEMLELLSAEPMDAARLTTALCARLDLTEDAEARTVVATRLIELAAIGLVQTE